MIENVLTGYMKQSSLVIREEKKKKKFQPQTTKMLQIGKDKKLESINKDSNFSAILE